MMTMHLEVVGTGNTSGVAGIDGRLGKSEPANVALILSSVIEEREEVESKKKQDMFGFLKRCP